jgi:hypothetical protein
MTSQTTTAGTPGGGSRPLAWYKRTVDVANTYHQHQLLRTHNPTIPLRSPGVLTWPFLSGRYRGVLFTVFSWHATQRQQRPVRLVRLLFAPYRYAVTAQDSPARPGRRARVLLISLTRSVPV